MSTGNCRTSTLFTTELFMITVCGETIALTGTNYVQQILKINVADHALVVLFFNGTMVK